MTVIYLTIKLVTNVICFQYYVQYIMYFLLCVHCYSNTHLYGYRYVLVSFFYIIIGMLLYQVMCTQEIHYTMY